MEFLRKIKGIFIASLLFGITAFIVLIMRIFPSKQRSLRRVIAKVVRTIVGYKVESLRASLMAVANFLC